MISQEELNESLLTFAGIRKPPVTVDAKTNDSVGLFIDNQLSDETKRAYRTDLKKWFAFLAGREPTQRIALDFRAQLERTVSSRSAARTENTIRTYYRFLGAENPWERVRSTKRVRNATPDVPATHVINDALERCDNLRDKAVIALLLNGLRRAEVADLRSVDWRWSDEYKCYIIRVIGKGNKERLVPATSETAKIVTEYLAQFERGSNFLIRAKRGHRITADMIAKIVKKWFPFEVHPHSLRHHYATRLVRGKANVFAIQKLMGHESVSTTQVYVNLDLADVIEEARKDPRNG